MYLSPAVKSLSVYSIGSLKADVESTMIVLTLESITGSYNIQLY